MALFQLVRWPWALLGCVHAVVGRGTGREFSFKVTPKGRAGTLPLPGNVVTPYLVIALLSALPTILGLDAGPAAGYRTLALINAGLYLAAAIAIVVLHVYEHPPTARRSVVAAIRPRITTTAAFTALIAVGIALPNVWVTDTTGPGAASGAPPPAWAREAGPSRLGVTTAALARNATIPWRPGDLAQV